MHPEVTRETFGACPACGMALESTAPDADNLANNPELEYMNRRLLFAAVLTIPVFFV